MERLTANLKQLYQCRVMWLYHVAFLGPTIPMVIEAAAKSEISVPSPLPTMAFFLFVITLSWGAGFSVLYYDTMKRSLC